MKRYRIARRPIEKEEEVLELPPRSALHQSDRTKLTRWFYRILIMAFSILTASLLVWGFLALNG